MKIIDSKNFISNMKADRYKDVIFKFCEMLEKKYGVKSSLEYREDNYRALRLDLHWPGEKHFENCGFVVINSRKWLSNEWTKPHTATYRKLFNSIFKQYAVDGFSYCRWGKRGIKYSTPIYKTVYEFLVALDLDNVNVMPQKI